MIGAVQDSQVGTNNAQSDEQKKKESSAKVHQHLSTAFVVVGIVSFVLGAIVNFYTIQRIRGGKA
jgi:uncharacterized protein YqhQ